MLIDEYNKELGRIEAMLQLIKKREVLENSVKYQNLSEITRMAKRLIMNISSTSLKTNLTIGEACPQKHGYMNEAKVVLWKSGLGLSFRDERTVRPSDRILLEMIRDGSEKIIAEMERLNRRKCTNRIRIASDVIGRFPETPDFLGHVYDFKHTFTTNINFGGSGVWRSSQRNWNHGISNTPIHNLSFSGRNILLNDNGIVLDIERPLDYLFIQYKYDEIMELLKKDIAKIEEMDKEQKVLVKELEQRYSKYLVAYELAGKKC